MEGVVQVRHKQILCVFASVKKAGKAQCLSVQALNVAHPSVLWLVYFMQ